MDTRYVDYATVDRHFYDSPGRRSGARGFEIADRPLPVQWRTRATGSWLVYEREDVTLPTQGWKIHASARPDNADEILGIIWDFCVPRGIAFKHLVNPYALLVNNSRNADRASSAKLAAIYPVDVYQFGRILARLAPLLAGRDGPYILSDLRVGDGPLYVRYGGFAKRLGLFDRGEPEPAIEDGTGRLVPDRREPVFRVPPWVTLPEFLVPHLAARDAVSVADLPYRIDRALHSSNGGGVYAGVDKRTGEPVVLKEARPFAGLDARGADAVDRLDRERKILAHLDGLDFVPAARDHLILAGHHFLVLDHIDGTPLSIEFARRYPLTGREADPRALRGYVEWVVPLLADLGRNVADLRQRGVVFGDLHPSNVLVRADGRTALVDFEAAGLASEGRPPGPGNPAFAAPADRSGFDVDRYALACLQLSMFLPLTPLLALDPGKAAEYADEIYETFPVPAGYLDDAVTLITRTPYRRTVERRRPRHPAHLVEAFRWPAARSSLAAGIHASATPDRADRLFPGDIAQFAGGGLNLAHGAAGVLYALHAAGAGRRTDHEQWLIDHARRRDPDARPGLYDGLHGITFVLDRLGHREEALALLPRGRRAAWRRLGVDLSGGLAGIGLTMQHFAAATGDAGLWDAATEVAEQVAARLTATEPATGGPPRAGLLRGYAGAALMFVRLYECTWDSGYLDLAAVALDGDLRRCVTRPDGALDVDEGGRAMPYLARGSAGIGLVLREFLAHRDEPRFTAALDRIMLAAASNFYAQPGLFNGRAGTLLLLAGARPGSQADAAAHRALVGEQVRRLGRHALSYRGHLAFPGDQLLRLSMDLATGAAGVLLALAAAAGRAGATLPFLSDPMPVAGA